LPDDGRAGLGDVDVDRGVHLVGHLSVGDDDLLARDAVVSADVPGPVAEILPDDEVAVDSGAGIEQVVEQDPADIVGVASDDPAAGDAGHLVLAEGHGRVEGVRLARVGDVGPPDARRYRGRAR